MIRNFSEIEAMLRESEEQKARSVGVVCAHDRHTLESIRQAQESHSIHAVLIGDEGEIRRITSEIGMESEDITIIPSSTDADSAEIGVMLAGKQEIDVLVKGNIPTREFLSAVVDSEKGIRRDGALLSHLAILSLPNYHKLLAITDGGMVIKPDLEQKRQLIGNAVDLFSCLGYEKPNVAVLTAVETVFPKLQDTVDAAALKQMNVDGTIPGCLVEGPISYDLAFSKSSAVIKGYESEITGEPDILLVPDITTGNILAKALIYSAGATMAGVTTGATVPIVLTSRGAGAQERYYSIILAALCR